MAASRMRFSKRLYTVQEADLSPGPFILTSSRVLVAQPSFPWAYEDIVIFAGRPLHFSKNVFGFLSAFSSLVWFLVAATLLATWATYVASSVAPLRPTRSGRLGLVHRRAEASSSFGLFVRTLLSQGIFLRAGPSTWCVHPFSVMYPLCQPGDVIRAERFGSSRS